MSQNSRNRGFSCYFCLIYRRVRSRNTALSTVWLTVMFCRASSGVNMPTPPAPQQQQQARQLMGVTTGEPPTIGSPDNVSIASTSQVGSYV
jgi:hypothetical protein